MITEYGIEAKSNSEIISELGARYKEYRLFSNLTQKEVAAKAGVSIFTISKKHRFWHNPFIIKEHRFLARSREAVAPTTYVAQPN